MEQNFDSDRPRHMRQPQRDSASDLTAWKIAGGVFLGLTLFYGVYRVHVAMEQRAAIEELNRTMVELAKPDADPLGLRAQAAAMRKAAAARARTDATQRALQLGQRCIGGQRFERVENGWHQLKDPC